MKKTFFQKVLATGCVDTRRYRYCASTVSTAAEQYGVIERLPLADVGTTAAINGWETVCTYGHTEAVDPAFDLDNVPGLADMYPPTESAASKKAVAPCDIPGWVGFLPFPDPCPYEGIGWYYREYNPDTQEGHGIFGTPENPQYMFEDAIIDGTLKHLHCGSGAGCFWTD